MRKIHHYSPVKSLGNCLICGEPILQAWYDKEEKNGRSEMYQDVKGGVVHYFCNGGKTLQELNEERKNK